MDTKGREILDKFQHLESERESWEQDWKEITRLVLPQSSLWEDSKGRGDRTGQDIFDGTAISALNLMANGLMGYLMSPMIRWFKLGLPVREAMDLPGAREWLETCESVLYNDFARSTIYEEGLEFFRKGGGLGTAVMYMEQDQKEGIPWFSTRHPKEVYLEADKRNRVDTVVRRYFLTARTMEQEFGRNNLPDDIQRACEDDPYDRFPIIHAVFPREDRDVTKINAQNKRYASLYVTEDHGEVLRESGYDSLPYIVWRWSTNSNEVYGRGQAHNALVKIKRANAMSRDLLRYSQLATDPPYNVPEHMRGQTRILPRGLNYYSNPNELITPVQIGGNYSIGLDQQQDTREIIENDFLVDFFLMLQRAPEGMTATEVMERQAEKAAVLGPIIGRIESDVLDKVIDIAFRQAAEAGRVPPPPPALRQLVGMPIKVDYIGPLAQANKKFHAQQGIQHSIQNFVPLLEVEPNLRGLVKWEQLGRELLENTGMPAGVVRDEREYRQWQQQLQAAQQQLQQQQQQQAMMENADKLGKRPEPGSPIEAIDQQMRGAMRTMQGAAQ